VPRRSLSVSARPDSKAGSSSISRIRYEEFGTTRDSDGPSTTVFTSRPFHDSKLHANLTVL
jgi:hypothetical protein